MQEKYQKQSKRKLLNNEPSKQRVEVGFTEEDFWIMFNDITKDMMFGTVEMTIIAGAIDTIKVNKNYKIFEVVDKDGKKIVELK